ncbi:ATP-dependent zinc metalloprotease FtsH [bacterium]|nr:ATP-dependent zinc metalloprotease FtsH [bacterium]
MKKKKSKRPSLRKGGSKRPSSSWRSFAIFTLFTFAALSLAGFFGNDSSKTKIIPYSLLKQEVRDGGIKKVEIGVEKIIAIPHDSALPHLQAKSVEDDAFVPLLEEKGIVFEGVEDQSWLSTFLFTWVFPILFFVFIWQFFIGRQMRGGPPGLMSFGKSRAKLVVEDKDRKARFDDVAGCDEAKEELQEFIDFLKNPARYKAIGGHIPKGVLLVGPPGTGKTLLARATAGEAGVNFFQISGSDFVEMFVGVGAARVRDLFKEAQSKSPCIIFIDELDAIAKTRGTNMIQSNDERENTLNQILVEMDGFAENIGVIIMAATNRPEVLDPAILRPGRFDRQIVVDRPDVQGREAILKVHAKKIKHEANIDFKDFAARTPMFTGADLANVVNEAALLAVRKGYTVVKADCFEEAIDRVVAGLAKKSRVMPADEKYTVAVHEVGHALVAHFSEESDPVHRISIIPRSSGALGFTMQIPEEERHLMSDIKLRTMIRVLLGGRAAEKVVIGKITTGASDDLKRASRIVRKMLMELGMGDSLGLVSLGDQNESYSGNPFVRQEYAAVSDDTAKRLDSELRAMLDEEFKRACMIVKEHRALLDKTVEKLLEIETLEKVQINELFPSKASLGL